MGQPTVGGRRATKTRLGVLYPGHAGESDYERYGARLQSGLAVHITNIPWGSNPDPVAAVKDLGALPRLLESATEMRDFRPDVVVWACTSGSFLWGMDGMIRQAQGLSAAFGVPATSTSLAYLDALNALGIKHVAIGCIYIDDITEAFVDLLEGAGITIDNLVHVPLENREEFLHHPELRSRADPAAGMAAWPLERYLRVIDDCNTPAADAVLIPDTAFRVADIMHDLESHAEKPVLMSNQVTVWSALRLAGTYAPQPSLDRLFSLPASS